MSNKPSNTKVPNDVDPNPEEGVEGVPQSNSVNVRASSHVIEINTEDSSPPERQVETATPTTAHRSHTTSERITSLYSTVIIEDLGDTESPPITTSVSQTGPINQHSPESGNAGANGNNNNGNMAVIPVSQVVAKNSQMIPIALLRKCSNNLSADECSAACNAGSGIMQIITSTNKVAPAEVSCNPELIGAAGASTTAVGAVLVMIPKKSDTAFDNVLSADQENNPAVQNQNSEQLPDANCSNAGSSQQPQDVTARPAHSYDSYEEVCRICHDNPSKMELISPCLCKGSMSKVHRACLERWLAESAKNSCEICNYEYNTVRKPKYKGCRSLYQWIRHPLSPSDMRNLFFDIACFFILTPLAAISSWLCVVGAQHYTFGEERRRRAKFHNEASALWDVHGHDPRGDASNATWTSVGLLSLTGTLLVAYSVWLFVAIKYHIQAWKEWQQRNYTVTIVPFEDGCMGRPPPPRPPRNQSDNSNNNNGSLLGGSDNANVYNFDANPNLLRYSGHNAVMRGRGGRSIYRPNRQGRRGYNLPPIFNRSHFLRNPPPGYTISETTMLYQALYGSDSDAFLNENYLAFFADSSDDVTESPSQVAPELPSTFALTASPSPTPEQPHISTDNPVRTRFSDSNIGNVDKEESCGTATTVVSDFPTCSSSVNNNQFLNVAGTEVRADSLTDATQEAKNSLSPTTVNGVENRLVLHIPCTNVDGNKNQENGQGSIQPD